ncbi:MAG: hypothetical protein JO227_06545 [Acetobacteraceae bacterium]|nr:hypothetical protein [Acetobacteraceae bacterium]
MTGATGMQWILELALVLLLAATLFHAIRLEKALGVLKRDRTVLEELVSGFNDSTRQAEAGIERLRATADGAGRQLGRQLEAVRSVKDDLAFLTQRGESLADKLDALVRAGRPLGGEASRPAAVSADAGSPDRSRVRSQAERDLLRALKVAR